MPNVREKKKVRVQTFTGGENSRAETTIIKQPFASLARGCDIDEVGKAKQRLGPSRTGDDPDSLIVDIPFHDSAATDNEGAILATNVTETSVTYTDGKFGIAAEFNGSTSSIKIDAAETEISANSMGDFVITCWVYVDTDGENDTGHIFDHSDATTYNGSITAGYKAWVHTESSSTVKLGFEVSYDSGAANAKVVTSTTMSTGAWHKLEFHHEVTGDSLDIYIDGVKASYDTDDAGGTTVDDDAAVDGYIGNSKGSDAAFDGKIERFRIYDGTRSSTEYEQDKIYGLTRYTVGSTIDKLYRVRDTNVEALDTNFKGWTEVDTGFTADKETNFVQANDLLFILNATENVHSMNLSEAFTDEGAGNEAGAGTSTNPPKALYGAWSQHNRLFLAGHPTESLRDYVWFSDVNDPQTWDTNLVTGNFFRVRSGAGGKITWLRPFKLNEMIIYKEHSIFSLDMSGSTPLTDWLLQPVNEEIGCRAGRTIQDIGNDHIFLDDELFVRLLTRTTFDKLRTSVISGPVQDLLDTLNVDAIEKCCSAFVNGKYYLSFPAGTATDNDTTIIWDGEAAQTNGNPESGWTVVPQGSWYPSVYAFYEFGDNKIRLVHADNRTISSVYKHDANTDDGKTISLDIAGAAHDFGNRSTDKIFGPLHCVWDAGESTTAEMFAEIDEQGFESLGTISLSGSASVLPIALPFNLAASDKATQLFTVKNLGRGKTCRIKAQHAQNNATATFVEYELYAEERIPKHG